MWLINKIQLFSIHFLFYFVLKAFPAPPDGMSRHVMSPNAAHPITSNSTPAIPFEI